MHKSHHLGISADLINETEFGVETQALKHDIFRSVGQSDFPHSGQAVRNISNYQNLLNFS